MELLKATGLNKSYQEGRVHVLRDVSLTIQKGEMVSLMGPSGSGKSTLLHLIGALDTADSGEILLENKNIHKLSDKELCLVRRSRIGFIFQFYNLLPNLTAIENVMLPSLLDGMASHKAKERALELLRKMDLVSRAQNKATELSGGQQQRVAIARSLMMEPALILADEPTGALDSKTAEEVLLLLKQLNKEFGQTLLMVTHDPKAASYANRQIEMMDGRIVKDSKK